MWYWGWPMCVCFCGTGRGLSMHGLMGWVGGTFGTEIGLGGVSTLGGADGLCVVLTLVILHYCCGG